MKKYYNLAILLLSVMIIATLSACGSSEKEDEVASEEVDNGVEYKVEGDLRSEVQLNIKRLMDKEMNNGKI